jgi:hypothetical protein
MAKMSKSKKQARPVAEEWVPNEAEALSMSEFVQEIAQRVPAPRVKLKMSEAMQYNITPDHPEEVAWNCSMRRAFGTTNSDFANMQMGLLANAISSGGEVKEDEVNSALAAMHGIQPRDEIESMLAAQMIAVHRGSMTMSRRLLSADNIEQQNSAVNALTKLNRTFTAQMEALNRNRGKGQQKMTVEHVHVHDGGQAIVGNVKGGGGDAKK